MHQCESTSVSGKRIGARHPRPHHPYLRSGSSASVAGKCRYDFVHGRSQLVVFDVFRNCLRSQSTWHRYIDTLGLGGPISQLDAMQGRLFSGPTPVGQISIPLGTKLDFILSDTGLLAFNGGAHGLPQAEWFNIPELILLVGFKAPEPAQALVARRSASCFPHRDSCDLTPLVIATRSVAQRKGTYLPSAKSCCFRNV